MSLMTNLSCDPLNNLRAALAEGMIDYRAIWDEVISKFRCDLNSVHGPEHWRRVERNCLMIAARNGADLDVVRLFAVLHDSCRLNDYGDPEHGFRAAEYAKEMRRRLYKIDNARFDILYQACKLHAHGHTSTEPTIGACWDADRLDLGRVGVIPDPSLFSTQAGSDLLKLRS
jgi:uncharacterized protein